MEIIKVISLLLSYPDEVLFTHHKELIDEVDESQYLNAASKQSLKKFITELTSQSILDAEEEYVSTFDRGRSTSLHLFEHVHGESRERGQAMIDLIEQYKAQGFDLKTKELPDYLPLFLEFLAHHPVTDVRDWLKEVGPILILLEERLKQRESRYHILFGVLLSIVGKAKNRDNIIKQIQNEKRDDMLEEIDKEWEEQAVKFMNNDIPTSCKAGSGDQPTYMEQRIPVSMLKVNRKSSTAGD